MKIYKRVIDDLKWAAEDNSNELVITGRDAKSILKTVGALYEALKGKPLPHEYEVQGIGDAIDSARLMG